MKRIFALCLLLAGCGIIRDPAAPCDEKEECSTAHGTTSGTTTVTIRIVLDTVPR